MYITNFLKPKLKMCDNKDAITDIIGYTGGIILSVCLAPQIYTTIKTKNVDNISYLWQILYITGILFHLYYSLAYNLLPIYIPTILELCLIIFMFILKICYTKKEKNKKKTNSNSNSNSNYLTEI